MNVFLVLLFLLLCLPSLLIFFYAPINLLWKVKIVATELGVFIAIFLVSLSFWFFSQPAMQYWGILGLLSSFIYLVPLAKSIILASKLPSQLAISFGEARNVQSKPLILRKLFGRNSRLEIKPISVFYSRKVDQELSMDIYGNISEKPKPCIISVHGGAWSSGDNKMFITFNKQLANEGYIVADVNYSLAPKHLFPTQKNDILVAIEYLEANASMFGIDTNNLFLLGRSAGGQIAATAAFHLGKQKIKGLICFYTPHDMVWGYSFPGNPLILDSRKVLRDYLGGSFEEAESNFYAASPLHNVHKNIPPLLLLHGESDEMVAYEHNLRLIREIKDFNIPFHLVSIPHGTHGFDFLPNSHGAQISLFAVKYFIHQFVN